MVYVRIYQSASWSWCPHGPLIYWVTCGAWTNRRNEVHMFQLNKSVQYSNLIHGTDSVFTYAHYWLIIIMVNVGKYTSPMQPSGSSRCIFFLDPQTRSQFVWWPETRTAFFGPTNHNMPSSFKPVKVSISGVSPSPRTKYCWWKKSCTSWGW